MGTSIADVRFELHTAYKTYVDQLLLAGNVSDFLLGNANIDAAGGQVEGSLRILLKDLLPGRVTVTHGHMVDKQAAVSNQQDVLITESFYTKSLIRSLDGTEFYPVEAIFATGEVKKTWSQQKLQSVIQSIQRSKQQLSRRIIPANQLSTGSGFVTLSGPVTNNPQRNPLFCFVFSLDFDKTYQQQKLAGIYHDPANTGLLPNVAVILKRGIYVLVDEDKLNQGELCVKLYPEFTEPGKKYRWILLTLEPAESLAYLIFMLTQHINDSVLEKVSAMDYAQTMIDVARSRITIL
jgi:hypothetical protein